MKKISEYIQIRKILNNEIYAYERVAFFFLSPLILLFALELMHLSYPGSILGSFSVFYPLKVVITYLFLLIVQWLMYALTFGNDILACLCNSIIFFMLAYANEVLAKITGDPLLPTNFLLAGQLKEISGFARIPVYPSVLVALAVLIRGHKRHIVICKRTGRILKTGIKIPFCIMGIIIFMISSYYLCIDYDFRHKVLPKVGVTTKAFNPIEDYYSNGMILTFFPRIGDALITAPELYTEIRMSEIKNEYIDMETLPAEGKTKPNVIIIQNEAFWDPTLLEQVKFNIDPMSNIRRLSEKYPSGIMFSSVFGGGTCMPEFECLTGMSASFLEAATYPYIQHTTSETVSTATVYKDSGYSTVAIHPYKKNFYGRNTAYPLLGFDEFIGIEDMQKSTNSGLYVSDASAVDEIIYQYENKKKERIFQFCVTMQNHGAYSGGRYKSYDIKIEESPLKDKDEKGLVDFAQGVFEADKEFDRLTKYFESQEEPTIIVMYGDHLPLLGTEGSTYMDSGYVDKKEVFEYFKYPQLYQTPYIVWANYDISDFELPEYTSPANIGLSVLKYANTGMPWYMEFFASVYKKYPVYQNRYIMNKNLEYLENVDPEDLNMIEDYKLIQFDLLDGEEYILEKEQ